MQHYTAGITLSYFIGNAGGNNGVFTFAIVIDQQACGVVINSGLSASSQDEPASLEWRWMREILPILDRFEENDQKCIFLRSNLDGFNH